MNGNKSFPRGVMFALGLGVILSAVGLFVTRQAVKSRSQLPQFSQVPAFRFTRSDGGTFSDQDLLGKVSVVDFIFTNCGDVCPVMTANMSGLYRQFQGSEAVQFVSISVDPANDTPAVLNNYARDHGVADRRWVFLCGPIEEVTALTEQGFLLPADDLPESHTSRFILVDRRGWIRGYYDGTGGMEVLAEHIRQLMKAES